MTRYSLLAPMILLTAATTFAQGPSVTVYSSADPLGFDPQALVSQARGNYNANFLRNVPGFGVVKEVRSIDLEAGVNPLSFTDVAAHIDPTTVSISAIDNPGSMAVLEQQFEFDLVSPDKILEKYLDRQITARAVLGDEIDIIEGKLLSSRDDTLVIMTDDGLRMLSRHSAQLQLGELPEGLITRPTLKWLVSTDRAGKREVRTTYQTAGLTWRADYNLVLNDDDDEASLAAWVTLLNLSGQTYEDATLKLVAGDVQRVQQQQPRVEYSRRVMAAADAGQQGFEEKAFFEYHLYTLPRTTDIPDSSTKQIALFPTAEGVKVDKTLAFEGAPHLRRYRGGSPYMGKQYGDPNATTHADVYLKFKNEERNNLGMPLPQGKVRVLKVDPDDGTLEFIGEDVIDHTPKNETLLIRVGSAFDVLGERTQTDFNVDRPARRITETYEIELRNAKDEDVDVTIVETLYRWSNWEILRSSDDFEKVDSKTIHFDVEVPDEGKKVVTYTVRYTW